MTAFSFAEEAFDYKLIVRGVAMGSAPFGWEVRGADGITSIYISTDRFRGMEAAYKAGQAWLAVHGRRKPAENIMSGLCASRHSNSSIDRRWRQRNGRWRG
jgi:hypothetical protein